MQTTNEATASAAEGIENSANSAGAKWVAEANLFLNDYLQNNPSLFCDDLWVAGLERPSSPRALGHVIRHAAKLNWIEEIRHDNGIVAKQSNSSNRQLKRVWKSLLYTGTEEIPPLPEDVQPELDLTIVPQETPVVVTPQSNQSIITLTVLGIGATLLSLVSPVACIVATSAIFVAILTKLK